MQKITIEEKVSLATFLAVDTNSQRKDMIIIDKYEALMIHPDLYDLVLILVKSGCASHYNNPLNTDNVNYTEEELLEFPNNHMYEVVLYDDFIGEIYDDLFVIYKKIYEYTYDIREMK